MPVISKPKFLLLFLVRHYFARFFDLELSGAAGETQANFIQALALIAVPGAFYSIYTALNYSIFNAQPFRSWTGLTDRYLFLSFSMAVIGLTASAEWNAFLPDERDYLILTPLPVPKRLLFTAKFVAVLLFICGAALATNACSTIMYPLFGAGGVALTGVMAMMFAHALTMLASGAFIVFSLAALRGVPSLVSSGRTFQFLSGLLQAAAFMVFAVSLILLPFLSFAIKNLVQHGSYILFWIPPCWFLGLYEVLLPGAAKPIFYPLERCALEALAVSFGLFLLVYLIGYKRFAQTLSVDVAPGRQRIGWLQRAGVLANRAIFKRPLERAIYEFIGKVVWRTPTLRGFLAAYAGVAVGFSALQAFDLDVRDGHLRLHYSQSSLFSIPFIVTFLLLTGLRFAFRFPSELTANWPFQMARDFARQDCIRGTRKWLLLRIVIPTFLFNFFWDLAHYDLHTAAFHFSFGLLLCALLVEALIWEYRSVPFATALSSQKSNMVIGAVIYGFAFWLFSYKAAIWLERLISKTGAAVSVLVTLAALYAGVRLVRSQFDHQQDLTFGDAADATEFSLTFSSSAIQLGE